MRTFDFTPLFRSTVGFDRLFDLMDTVPDQAQSYPPYNIERVDETHYRITLAVAGFAEKDLQAEVREGVLTVIGKREACEEPKFLYQGIAGRSFERRFQLAEYVEVRHAVLENGLLHIDLERVIPEEKKPRQILINASQAGAKVLEAALA
ncbi:MAG: Hsp20 family protein [Rhizomicrobium sp.]